MSDEKITSANSSDKKISCSFCGKSQEEVKKLIAGPNVYICNECVILCKDILVEDDKIDTKKKFEIPKPSEIYDYLDDHIIGQDHAKKYSPFLYIITTRECKILQRILKYLNQIYY